MKKLILSLVIIVASEFLNAQPNSSYDFDSNGLGGTNNTGFGNGSLPGSTSGTENTAFGDNSLLNNLTGNYNCANGYECMYINEDGSRNTAMGRAAMYNNGCSGCGNVDDNTAAGVSALYLNQSGIENTAKGNFALANNIVGRNTANGYQALFWNTATASGAGEYNTATGFNALLGNTIGAKNTAIGALSLGSNTEGIENTAIGYSALILNSVAGGVYGSGNTAAGHLAMENNSSGSYNTGIGSNVMDQNTTGDFNVAFGVDNSYSGVSGNQNTSMGHAALYGNSTGNANVAIGKDALLSNNSTENTAVGAYALNGNTSSGQQLTVVGANALQSANSLVGNTIIGANADISGSNIANAFAFGYGAITNQTNKMRFGNNATFMRVETIVAVSNISDKRFKKDVSEEIVKGIEFIRLLRPVQYNYDSRKNTEFVTKDLAKDKRDRLMSRDFEKDKDARLSGFIAQEVEEAAKKVGYDFEGVRSPKNADDYYTVAYGAFVVPLTKAVQEEQTLLKEQMQQTEALLATLDGQSATTGNSLVENKQEISSSSVEFNMEAIPNPFSYETVIHFEIPGVLQNAQLFISDLSGNKLLVYELNQNSGKVVVDGSKLQPGLYNYTIVSGNVILGTKRMALTSK